MIRLILIPALLIVTTLHAQERAAESVPAPDDWRGETIQLPPGFARDLSWKGVEQIRFAPGMMTPQSDTFFTYVFVFELQPTPVLNEQNIKDEFLKYYRGLCKAVLNGQKPDVDPSTFTLTLKRVKPDKPKPDSTLSRKAASKKAGTDNTDNGQAMYSGLLDWVEPFATNKRQKLHLEILTWNDGKKGFVFACVSPLPTDKPIWETMRSVRKKYLRP